MRFAEPGRNRLVPRSQLRKVRRRQCAVDGKKRLISHVGFLPAVALIFALSGAATATAQDNTAYGDDPHGQCYFGFSGGQRFRQLCA